MSIFKYMGRLFGLTSPPQGINRLYKIIVAQARNTTFYTDLGVPDSVAGRFDLISLHVFVVMRRLKDLGEDGQETSQELFDVMFTDMDRNMREMGVGDMGVGKKVKALAISFYGRIKAYDEGLEQGDEVLMESLRRNLYSETDVDRTNLKTMMNYMKQEIIGSANWELKNIAAGNIEFGNILISEQG